MADIIDHAWDALIYYGADPSEYDDTLPELDDDDWDAIEIEEQERQFIEDYEEEQAWS